MGYLRWLSLSEKKLFITILTFAAGLWTIDAIDDLRRGASLQHIFIEGLIIGFATICVILFAYKYIISKRENFFIKSDLAKVRSAMQKFKEETRHLAEGLSIKIDRELDAWKLTNAEKEITLLLLKGMAIKEISEIRGTSEKTITQQVSAVYQKSGLRGRAELSAYFLEDLLSLPYN